MKVDEINEIKQRENPTQTGHAPCKSMFPSRDASALFNLLPVPFDTALNTSSFSSTAGAGVFPAVAAAAAADDDDDDGNVAVAGACDGNDEEAVAEDPAAAAVAVPGRDAAAREGFAGVDSNMSRKLASMVDFDVAPVVVVFDFEGPAAAPRMSSVLSSLRKLAWVLRIRCRVLTIRC